MPRRVVIQPTQPIRLVGGEQYLSRVLRGRSVIEGQTVRVDVIGNSITLVIAKVLPKGIAIVTDDTEIELKEEPYKPEEGKKEVSDIHYEDIGGLGRELQLVREMIELPAASPGDLRAARYSAAQGCPALRTSGYGKDPDCKGRCKRGGCPLHLALRPGDHEQVLRRERERAPGEIRRSRTECPGDHLHRRDRLNCPQTGGDQGRSRTACCCPAPLPDGRSQGTGAGHCHRRNQPSGLDRPCTPARWPVSTARSRSVSRTRKEGWRSSRSIPAAYRWQMM